MQSDHENTIIKTGGPIAENSVDVEFRRIADEYKKTEEEFTNISNLVRQEPTAENIEKQHRLQIQLAVLKKMKEEILDRKIAAVMNANNEEGKKIWE